MGTADLPADQEEAIMQQGLKKWEKGEEKHNEKRVFLSRAKERIPERGSTVRWQLVMFPELVKDIGSAICSKDDK